MFVLDKQIISNDSTKLIIDIDYSNLKYPTDLAVIMLLFSFIKKLIKLSKICLNAIIRS